MDALCHLSTASATYPHFSPRLSTMEMARRQDGKTASREVEESRRVLVVLLHPLSEATPPEAKPAPPPWAYVRG
jgi:hypothetical protein